MEIEYKAFQGKAIESQFDALAALRITVFRDYPYLYEGDVAYDETEDVKKPFKDAGMRLSEIFYFGESILLSEFRGLGIGNKFFDAREAHATGFGTFHSTCFCAVQRPEDHPMRPDGYQPLDGFWIKRGYRKVPELVSHFEWKDVGESESTAKPMMYWMRNF